MTRTLILTVDRDNDLGSKTAIRGPVVGRRNVLTAALKLGIADPEESDTNAILGALSQYDNSVENKKDEDEIEVAILTGDEKVGLRSDRAIAAQLDDVVKAFQPDQAVLITDGAEDESVLPIIQSQVRIDHVQKIIVKQSKGIEGTYYYIVKALEDPKWRARFMIPMGIIIAILGFGIMLPNDIGGVVIGALPLLIGLYLLSKGAGIDDNVARVVQEMRENVDGAFFSIIAWVLTGFSALIGGIEGYRVYTELSEGDQATTSIIWLETFHASLTWVVFSFVLLSLGFLALRLRRGTISGRFIILPIFGMVMYYFIDASLDITTEVILGTFEFSITNVTEALKRPILMTAVLWVATMINKSLRKKQTPADKYWGI